MELKISKKAKAISPSPTLAIDSKFKMMKQQGIPVVGFGAGEPDFNTPDAIKQAGIDAINNNITKYTPASGTVEIKQAVCDKIKRDTGLDYNISNIVVSNGGKHSLQNTFIIPYLRMKGKQILQKIANIQNCFKLAYFEANHR